MMELLSDDEVFQDDDDNKSEASSYVSSISEKQPSAVESKKEHEKTPSRRAGNDHMMVPFPLFSRFLLSEQDQFVLRTTKNNRQAKLGKRHELHLIFNLDTVHPLGNNERFSYYLIVTCLCLIHSDNDGVFFLCFYPHIALCIRPVWRNVARKPK